MDYKITRLTDELIFIRWYRTPTVHSGSEEQFLTELERLLNESSGPLYFISDLRRGRIANVRSIQRLGALTQHKNWAGSTAFSRDPVTSLLVRSFQLFAHSAQSKNEMQSTPEEALSFIESLKPGVTEGVDWVKVLNEA
ncbi:MAG: hypothetical protein HZC41_04935 [Chloroflexi bacterium]|nr:hypothetical protein [Chloroflexota bacterium]